MQDRSAGILGLLANRISVEKFRSVVDVFVEFSRVDHRSSMVSRLSRRNEGTGSGDFAIDRKCLPCRGDTRRYAGARGRGDAPEQGLVLFRRARGRLAAVHESVRLPGRGQRRRQDRLHPCHRRRCRARHRLGRPQASTTISRGTTAPSRRCASWPTPICTGLRETASNMTFNGHSIYPRQLSQYRQLFPARAGRTRRATAIYDTGFQSFQRPH